MKKILVFVLAAGIFASCSNAGNSAAKDVKDSLDSVTKLKTQSIDDAAKQAKDTIVKSNDSLKKMVDSTAKKASDSLKKSK